LGLTVGMGIGALLFAGMFLLAEYAPLPSAAPVSAQSIAPTQPIPIQPSPTSIFASILPTNFAPATFAPTPGKMVNLPRKATLTPTATGIPEPLIFPGPLNGEEQAQLHAASLHYVAPDYYASKAIGEEINGVGYGYPSNICGPLAIAILQDAYLVSAKIDPYEFWLLNPDVYEDRLKLERAFPDERFSRLRTKTPINEYDWETFPLLPGDFLYLYSGSRGNFEHMLAVTRVDEIGRAYAVTNHKTEESGFIITEELLYDPNNPGEGLFYEWTEREKAELGSTGFGGFQLWRLREK